MGLDFLIKGAVVGFSIAAPVGPIGVLCIRRTLASGKLSGLFSGIGAATANSIYASILVSGLTLISDCLLKMNLWLHIFGGSFLFYLGIKTFLAKPKDVTKKISHKTLLTDFISTFFLTLSNPLTILAYLAVFTSFDLSNLGGNWSSNLLLVLGVFTGATTWWFLLSEIVSFFGKKVNQKAMIYVNRITGTIISGFGLLAILSVIH
ncbi:MAG: LysE family translocator [Chlamydiae bacterium]|jgi:threonine/homoserine/homoserine lactone efflux protein|nr:LysE family translocator [Chlamydiota bacterium]